MNLRLFVLARSHRRSNESMLCAGCQKYKCNVAPVAVAPESGPGEVVVLGVCSGCVRSMLDTASGGRKPERP